MLYAKGLSFAKIAQAIGGVSRNAAIGKANRLGIARRDNKSNHGGKRVRVFKPVVVAPEPQPIGDIEPATIDGKRVTLMMLGDGMCKWPISDPKSEDFHYCGQPKAPNSPYCCGHRIRAYQPLKPLAKGFAP